MMPFEARLLLISVGPSAWHISNIFSSGRAALISSEKEAAAVLGDVGTGDPAGWWDIGAPGCEGAPSLLPPLTLPGQMELLSLHPRV